MRIISGGACGNDPAYAGYVGKGMLTAAVFGKLKSAPTVYSIIEIIKILGVSHFPGKKSINKLQYQNQNFNV